MTLRDVEPFDRQEFIESAARAMFVSAWADRMEEQGESFSGMQLMDVAPDTPPAAVKAGRALATAYELANGRKLKALWKLAVTVPGKHYRDPTVDELGHYFAMQSLGHGVGWFDDHPDFPLVMPHAELYVEPDGKHIWWEVQKYPKPARGRAPGRSAEPNRRRGRRMRRNGRVLGQIGSGNAIEYGGGMVFETESDSPMLEYTHGLETEHPESYSMDEGEQDLPLTVYAVDLGSSGAEFYARHNWVAWKGIASYTGQSVKELRGYAKSDDPMSRAMVAQDIGSYHGWHELDQSPMTFSAGELEERWATG